MWKSNWDDHCGPSGYGIRSGDRPALKNNLSGALVSGASSQIFGRRFKIIPLLVSSRASHIPVCLRVMCVNQIENQARAAAKLIVILGCVDIF